jgi:phospholipid/cholesterol/gamma-HCH transport system ATP-binding protein
METPLIEFRDVTKRFGERTILNGVNLEIYENQITTIMGKSGVGKSVLLKHIIGLLSPDAGSILFKGKPVSRMRKGQWDGYRSQISYLFQSNALFDSMTVFDNVALPLRQTTAMDAKEIEKKVMARIEQTDLAEAAAKYPSELSGGMQKRVALARALVTDPKIVLFDEPTTGQDPIRKNVILSTIAHYRKKFGFTAVLVSHDIPDVYFISDRIILLWEGNVVFQGPYEDWTKVDHPMAQEFLRSLEGFQDELTGVLSKQMFRTRYAMMLTERRAEKSGSAACFSVRFDLLVEAIGHVAAAEVLRALGEYVNSNLGHLGGFSVRTHTGEILAVLPHTELREAQQFVKTLGDGLQKEALSKMEVLTGAKLGITSCFEISIYAGVTETDPGDDIERIIKRARENQGIIAMHRCDARGEAT